MKILLAAPDRDFLTCYSKLLEGEFGEIVTAFDGPQIIAFVSSEPFDGVILDSNLPRMASKAIIARVQEKGVPVLVLTPSPVSAHQLTEEPLPNGFLAYPFTAATLTETLRDMLEKASTGECLSIGGTEIDVPSFRIRGGPSLTTGEINVIRALQNDEVLSTDQGAYISALNVKLAQAGSKKSIKYRARKGFELVNEDE